MLPPEHRFTKVFRTYHVLSVSNVMVSLSMTMMRKIAGIMLLLFAAVDVGFPSLCRAEALVPASQDSFAAASPLEVCAHNLPDSQPQSQDEGDCFCCSTHIAPRAHMVMQAQSEIVLPLVELSPQDPSSGMTPLPYHPPRA